MNHRKWLAELDGKRLIDVFELGAEVAGDAAESAGANAVMDVCVDLARNYPGIQLFIEHLLDGFEEEDGTKDFVQGARAGATMLLQVLRMAAETEDILGSPEAGADGAR